MYTNRDPRTNAGCQPQTIQAPSHPPIPLVSAAPSCCLLLPFAPPSASLAGISTGSCMSFGGGCHVGDAVPSIAGSSGGGKGYIPAGSEGSAGTAGPKPPAGAPSGWRPGVGMSSTTTGLPSPVLSDVPRAPVFHPTEPSSFSDMSWFTSAANSIGSSLNTSRQNPLMMVATASSGSIPLCWK